MNTRINLPTTSFSGLEFDNIMTDVQNLIIENPEYNENWDDFLSSNSGRMIVSLFSYIADHLATRIDWYGNESFIGTATQKSSILKLLKIIGYKFSLPNCARVVVNLEFNKKFVLESGYNLTNSQIQNNRPVIINFLEDGSIVPTINTLKLNTLDRNGNPITFESLRLSENSKFNYFDVNKIKQEDVNLSKTQQVMFYEGETKFVKFIANKSNNQKFHIPDSPIANNSIRVYTSIFNNASNSYELYEFNEVNSFLDPNSQREKIETRDINRPYVINTGADNNAEIEFAPVELVPENRLIQEGEEILVIYRVGGGIRGNITKRSINTYLKFKDDNDEEISVKYINNQEGVGGVDSETAEHASKYGPLQVRASGRTVTHEDYSTVLNSLPNLLTTKSYSHNNFPQDCYDKYGIIISPYEVWNFIVLKQSGWESLHTDKYNFANWGTLNLQNRFNGKYWYTDGILGHQLSYKIKGYDINNEPIFRKELIKEGMFNVTGIDGSVDSMFYNYYIIDTPEDFKEYIFIEQLIDPNGDPNDDSNIEIILNPSFKGSLTYKEYIKNTHIKLEDIDDWIFDLDEINEEERYFYGKKSEVDDSYKNILKKDINAFLVSKKIHNENISLVDGNNIIKIYMDTHQDTLVSVDLLNCDTVNGEGEFVTLEEIANRINYCLDETLGNINPFHDFGLKIEAMSYAEALEVILPETIHEFEYYDLIINDKTYEIYTDPDINGVARGFEYYEDLLLVINNEINPDGLTADLEMKRYGSENNYDIVIRFIDPDAIENEDKNIILGYSIEEDLIAILLDNFDGVQTSPVVRGNYLNTAEVIQFDGGKYIKMTSPIKSSFSKIRLKNEIDSAIYKVFGYNNEAEYISYGEQKATIILDSSSNNFGKIIFEYGGYMFDHEDQDYIYINYIKNTKNRIILGNYFKDNFNPEDPEYREHDKRLYNSQYIQDPTSVMEKDEIFSLTDSNIELRFSLNETNENSIYKIDNTFNSKLTETKLVKKISENIEDPSSFNGEELTIEIYNESDDVSPFSTFIVTFSGISNNKDGIIETRNKIFNAIGEYVDVVGYTILNDLFEYNNTNYIEFIIKKPKVVFKHNANTASAFYRLFGNNSGEDLELITNKGDYYLELVYDRDENGNIIENLDDPRSGHIEMIPTSLEKYPDEPFYIHYLVDNRHHFKNDVYKKTQTDEDDLQRFLNDYRITGISNVFKIPRFRTFSISSEVYCFPNIPIQDIERDILNQLYENYSLEKSELGKNINKSEVLKIIMDVSGVRYANIDYFGEDLENKTNNEIATIKVDFDQICILSSESKNRTGAIIKGANLNLKVI